LVGWALASAWSQKRYLRLGTTYAFAILMHGLWNGMAVLSSISSLKGQVNIEIPATLLQIGSFATIAIVALSAFNLVFYISFNAILRNNIKTKASLSAGDGEAPSLTMSGSISTEQIEFSSPPSRTSSPPVTVDTPPLPSSDAQPFTAIENPPNNPESNP
jgi:hypothetical protein